jgi:hypothetical protein
MPALQTIQSSIWWVPWALPAGVKMLACRAYHSPPFSVKVLTAMKSYLHFLIHFLGIVLAYAQWKIYVLTMRNTTNKCIYY